jgi:hypothetical protein
VDKSEHDGRIYSNKAPGMSLAAIPAYLVVTAGGGTASDGMPRGRWLWFLRVMTSGLAFVAAVALVSRLADRLGGGYGLATAVAFGLGTLAPAFAATAYDHLPATALLLGAFAAAVGGRTALAGTAAGAAVLVEYQSGVAWIVLLVYIAIRGTGSALRYVTASLPSIALLGAYDWAAFGAPWHTPLTYSDNRYETAHQSGLLGIHLPSLHGTELVFLGQKGLLVMSPVLVLAAVGLAAMWRQRRAEAAVCAAVAAAYLVAEAGYFDPYAGFSPGPRYAIPGLAFLALGLPYAFRRAPRLTWLLTGASVVACTAITLTWARGSDRYAGTIWTQVFDLVTRRGRAPLAPLVAPAVVPVAHSTLVDAVAVTVAAALALSLGYLVPSATSHVAGTPRRRKFHRATSVAQDTSV